MYIIYNSFQCKNIHNFDVNIFVTYLCIITNRNSDKFRLRIPKLKINAQSAQFHAFLFVFQFKAVTNFVLMIQGDVHSSFLSGKLYSTEGYRRTKVPWRFGPILITYTRAIQSRWYKTIRRWKDARTGTSGSDEAQNRIKVISDKSEHPPRTCSENSFSPRSGCDESNGKLEEQRRTMTVTRRRQNNRAEAEGDEVFELWTEVPSSFLHPLHFDSRSKKRKK